MKPHRDDDDLFEDDEEGRSDETVPFFNPVPSVVLVLLAVIAGVEIVLRGGEMGLWGGPMALGWRTDLIQHIGFSDTLFERLLLARDLNFEWFYRLLSYPFVSSSVREFLIGLVFIIAAGKYAGERMTTFTFAVLVVTSVVFGAVLYAFIMDDDQFLTGPYTMGFGLLGFYVFRQFLKARNGQISYLDAFKVPIFILTLDIVLTLILNAPLRTISRICALIAGFILSFAISRKGHISWYSLKKRLGRL